MVKKLTIPKIPNRELEVGVQYYPCPPAATFSMHSHALVAKGFPSEQLLRHRAPKFVLQILVDMSIAVIVRSIKKRENPLLFL